MLPTDNNLESEFTFENAAVPVPEDPPFHILLLGNWCGDSINRDLADRHPVEIDRDNFDDVIKRFKVTLNLDWQGIETEQLSLEFSELDDFHPDNLFKNVSLFSDLRDIRQRLSDSDTFNSAANEVRSWFRTDDRQTVVSSAPDQNNDSPPVESDNLLDFILSNPVESPTSVKPRVIDNSELGRFVSNIVSPHLIQIDENEQSTLISAVDATISELMRTILHHPKFQALESAWRGLYFLVRRLETDVDLKIFITQVSKQELSDNLKSVSDLTDSFLHRQLTSASGESFALTGGNFSFELTVDDIATLMRIGKISSSLIVPFISHLKPEIFGLKDFSELVDNTQLKVESDSTEAKLWNALRSVPEAESIGLSPMRMLARLPFGSATESIESFSFEEFIDGYSHHSYVWMNPCFGLILLLAKSYRLSGWDMADNFRNELDNLPLHYFSNNGETVTKACAEIVLTESALEKVLEQGLIPIVSYRDSDKVRVARFQSISNSSHKLAAKW